MSQHSTLTEIHRAVHWVEEGAGAVVGDIATTYADDVDRDPNLAVNVHKMAAVIDTTAVTTRYYVLIDNSPITWQEMATASGGFSFADNVKLYFGTGNDVSFHFDGTNFILTPSGKFGIGTLTPAKLLELSGAAATLRITDTNGKSNIQMLNSTDPAGDGTELGRFTYQGVDDASGIITAAYVSGFMEEDATGAIDASLRLIWFDGGAVAHGSWPAVFRGPGLGIGTGGAEPAAAADINSPDASTVGLIVNTASSPTATPIRIRENNSDIVTLGGDGATYARFNALVTQAFDNGASIGTRVWLRHNNNGATPAAAAILMSDLNGTNRNIWPDATGDIRTGTTSPTNANDLSGVVVGDQTSLLSTKNLTGEPPTPNEALATMLDTPVYRFKYKSGSRSNSEYIGIATDTSPEFGQDQNRSFSPVSAFGYTVQAFKALEERISYLEKRLQDGQITH